MPAGIPAKMLLMKTINPNTKADTAPTKTVRRTKFRNSDARP
jgi:hypothetical protein